MKKPVVIIVALFVLLTIFIQCRTSRQVALNREMKHIYINDFKLAYFKQTLLKAYNHSQEVREIIYEDNSAFGEIILSLQDRKLIDSLSSIAHEKIKADSAVGNRRAEGTQGKRPFKFLIEDLESKWLDSIAHKQYKSSLIMNY